MESNGTASVGVYMFYYAKTAQDPKFKLEDPREYTEENRLKVRFDPEKYKEGHPHDELSTWTGSVFPMGMT